MLGPRSDRGRAARGRVRRRASARLWRNALAIGSGGPPLSPVESAFGGPVLLTEWGIKDTHHRQGGVSAPRERCKSRSSTDPIAPAGIAAWVRCVENRLKTQTFWCRPREWGHRWVSFGSGRALLEALARDRAERQLSRWTNSLNQTIYPRLPQALQNVACTAGGFLRYRRRFSDHFQQMLAEWVETENQPVERLHELQRQRLSRRVEQARERVPYYRDLPPPSERSDPLAAIEEMLSALPPLEKRHYRDQPEAFMSRGLPRSRLHVAQTSGTTGTALPLWHSPETLAEEYATVWRMRRRVGVGIDDPYLSFAGQVIVPVGQDRPPFWRTNYYGGQTLFSIYHMTRENLWDYVNAVHHAPARYVQGYPSSIHLVARALLEADCPIPEGKLAAVFTSSESLLAFQRETIEEAFGAPVLDRYGVSEFAVSMTECGSGRLHVDMEFCIVEVEVVEETDEYEAGPLLITALAHDATPLFRYRIGDVGSRARAPCPCGRPGDSFYEVDGRVEDYVLTPSGRLVGRMDHVFKDQLAVAEAQILQEDASAIEVLIVPRAVYNEASERKVLREIRSRLGEEIDVKVRIVSEIAREPNGKFRAVKSVVGRNSGQW